MNYIAKRVLWIRMTQSYVQPGEVVDLDEDTARLLMAKGFLVPQPRREVGSVGEALGSSIDQGSSAPRQVGVDGVSRETIDEVSNNGTDD